MANRSQGIDATDSVKGPRDVFRQLVTTSGEGELWCGVDVDAYWCEASKGKPYVYVRAHATRNTLAREQRNAGFNCAGKSEGEILALCSELLAGFTAWEAARRTDTAGLDAPWSRRELRVLRRLDRLQPWKPVWARLEDLGLCAKPKHSEWLYRLLDRYRAKQRPTWSELSGAAHATGKGFTAGGAS